MMHRLRRHHHNHHQHDHDEEPNGGRRGRRRGGRFEGDLDTLISFLEERQRDLEQATADLAERIRRLKERRARGSMAQGLRTRAATGADAPVDAPVPEAPSADAS